MTDVDQVWNINIEPLSDQQKRDAAAYVCNIADNVADQLELLDMLDLTEYAP